MMLMDIFLTVFNATFICCFFPPPQLPVILPWMDSHSVIEVCVTLFYLHYNSMFSATSETSLSLQRVFCYYFHCSICLQ